MKIINGRGEEQAGGDAQDLQTHIQEMLDNCSAVKGEAFAQLVSDQFAVLQLSLLMRGMLAAGLGRNQAFAESLEETHQAVCADILMSLMEGWSDADVEESARLSKDFFSRQMDAIDRRAS